MKRSFTVSVIALLLVCSMGTEAIVLASQDREEIQENLKDIRKKKDEAQKDINKVVEDIKKVKEEMNSIEKEMDETREKIEKVGKELEAAKQDVEKFKDVFKKRLRFMYQKGELGYMHTLFEAESFGQFLERFESIRIIVRQDHAAMDKYYQIQLKVEEKKKELVALQDKQKEQQKEATKVYEELTAAMEEHQGVIAELEEEEELKEAELRKLNLEMMKSGNFPYTGPLSRPSNGRVSSPYGYRNDPLGRGQRLHTGIDYAAPLNSPIYAAADGVVRKAQWAGGYGFVIVIDHGGGISTLYAHMYSHQARVRVGQVVERGQVIGGTGNAGNSTGPHLHFEVRKNGTPVNPVPYMR